eukprot:3063656-Ditylum_brightwellii.AAC.1
MEEVISHFRIFAESMKRKKNTKENNYSANLHNLLNKAMHPEIYEIKNDFLEQKTGKKKTWYAACTLQHYPVASDANDETKDGCVLILNEHFVD